MAARTEQISQLEQMRRCTNMESSEQDLIELSVARAPNTTLQNTPPIPSSNNAYHPIVNDNGAFWPWVRNPQNDIPEHVDDDEESPAVTRDEAKLYRHRVTHLPDIDPRDDPTIQEVMGQEDYWVDKMLSAIHNEKGIHDNSTRKAPCITESAKGYVGRFRIKSNCRLLFLAIIDRCVNGFRGWTFPDRARNKDYIFPSDKYASCKQRMKNVCRTLKVWKCASNDILDAESKSTVSLANAPMAYSFDKFRNKYNNNAKGLRQEYERRLAKLTKTTKSDKELKDIKEAVRTSQQDNQGTSGAPTLGPPQSNHTPRPGSLPVFGAPTASVSHQGASIPNSRSIPAPGHLLGISAFQAHGYRHNPPTSNHRGQFRIPMQEGPYMPIFSQNSAPFYVHISPQHSNSLIGLSQHSTHNTRHNETIGSYIGEGSYDPSPSLIPAGASNSLPSWSPHSAPERQRNAQATNNSKVAHPDQLSGDLARSLDDKENNTLNTNNTSTAKRSQPEDFQHYQSSRASKKPRAIGPVSPYLQGVSEAPGPNFKSSFKDFLPLSPLSGSALGLLAGNDWVDTSFTAHRDYNDYGLGMGQYSPPENPFLISDDENDEDVDDETNEDSGCQNNAEFNNFLGHLLNTAQELGNDIAPEHNFETTDSLGSRFEDVPGPLNGNTQEHPHDATPQHEASAS